MTREEREQALEWFRNRPVTMSGAKKMYNLAIEALSKQEPKSPKMPLDAYYICPACGKKISMYDEYCCRCGQSLGRWWEG